MWSDGINGIKGGKKVQNRCLAAVFHTHKKCVEWPSRHDKAMQNLTLGHSGKLASRVMCGKVSLEMQGEPLK